ncbi:Ferredoxin-sulfite reductase [Prochlorococcus marinus subsp. pastoris str. CCMP1986]|uniref:Ferredoxin-sulfite reductase n=1 Tax=Prochlorococcus marinus subsp. pastoris (strain CCMP1986 / NIES-2087 / MED4) TaxID=59919 RepID=Q7V1U7_PROMP|nr:NADPH-dependent assimilatory sulfite reductase hemoprotein subunit [Prochlorococcus marinus]KGF85851.1 Ferredoxin--sulfite reductase [Prochlorococcus marinus str. EQPAC1]CAE19217.1 Ferredoxin-sulfite reductase [Prochlorococcus marinus subsp. pastoris str. CCMP1986]
MIKVEKVKKKKEIAKQEIVCLANGLEVSKFENFKKGSEFLKEPLASELKNESDHFTNDAVQLLKFHGSYQQDNRENRKPGKSKDWQMMLRLRSPGGEIPGNLFLSLDELSDKLGNGTLRVTTRQAFQMHGIRKDNLKEVIKSIVNSMGSTLAACGDINRNVMAPAAPFETAEYITARTLAVKVADLLTPMAGQGTFLELWADGDLEYTIKPDKEIEENRKLQFKENVFSGTKKEPLYGSTYLPRKFKCAVTVPGDNSVDLLTNDIGIVAFTSKEGSFEGCNFYIGGGMGRTHNNEETFARIADPLGYVENKDTYELIQSIVAIQRDYGDRKSRKNSRMKYLLHRKGIKWFKKILSDKYFRKEIKPLRKEPENKLIDYLGWHKQNEDYFFVGLPLLSGRLSGKKKSLIRDLVKENDLYLRLTPNQDILLCNIPNKNKSKIKKALKKIGYDNLNDINEIQRHALACPALPLCGLAMTEAERILPEVLTRIENLLTDMNIEKTILFRMTGCPNGCTRPYMAELALVGSGQNKYQLWLGGSKNLQRLAKPYLQRMELDDLERTIQPLLELWKKSSAEKDFGDFINNQTESFITNLLSEIN